VTNIHTDKHSLGEQILGETQVEQVTAELRVHLSQNIGCDGQVELLASSESQTLGDNILAVAHILDSLILVLISQHQESDLGLSELFNILLKLLLKNVSFLETVQLNPLRLLDDHSKSD
jgi:hypothetical protein